MRRLFLGIWLLFSAVAVWQTQADESATPKPAASDSNPLDEQRRLSQQYQELERQLLKLAHKMERSPSLEDRSRAKRIQKAVSEARDRNISGNLEKLTKLLASSALDNLKQATDSGAAVKGDLERILAILMSDPKEEQEWYKQLIAMLDAAIHKQKIAKAQNQSSNISKADAKGAQEKATEEVKRILEKIDQRDKQKQTEAKDKDKDKDKSGDKAKGQDGKPKDPKDGKDKGKDGKDGKPQDGDPMDQDGEQGQGQKGEDGEQQEKTPGRKKIKDAQDDQKEAEKNLNQDDRNNAEKNQEEALKKLQEAKKKLEEILRQMREEEIERILAALRERCEKMLRLQEAVYQSTLSLDQRIRSIADKKPTREEEQDSRVLAEKEAEIVQEADHAINLLKEEGTAVAFPEVFHQVRNDMIQVERRLARTDPGGETQAIEQDIIATLKEMIEALKKAQQDQQNRRNQGQNGPPPPQSLLDLIAELKMIRAMQVRVNKRTTLWGQRYPGEQAQVPEIVTELKELATRQFRIFEITNNIAKGKNK